MTGLIPKNLSGNKKIFFSRLSWVIIPLLLGGWIYLKGRKMPVLFETWFYTSKETSSFPGSIWIPDYLWCVSLWMAMVLVWNGWNNIPKIWKWVLWTLISATELFQWLGWIEGTGDWIDVLMYQLAILTVYILHKTQRI